MSEANAAQTPATVARLTVRPSAMATGQRTVRAGEQQLDSLPDYRVYVPGQCVGTRRCPLVVALHGAGGRSRDQIDLYRPLADKYGMIILAPSAATPGTWDVWNTDLLLRRMITWDKNLRDFLRVHDFGRPDSSAPKSVDAFQYPDLKNIDAALKQVLHKFAIDPDKIALAGMSDGGRYALFLGPDNLDVFSRIAVLSPGGPYALFLGHDDSTVSDVLRRLATVSPSRKIADTVWRGVPRQFFLGVGIGEGDLAKKSFGFPMPLQLGPELQREGHVVKSVLALRIHEERQEDYDAMMRWLQESWALPTQSVRTAPRAVAGAVPPLTLEVLARITDFWTRFMHEPDSVRTTGRIAHQKEIMVPVGHSQMSLTMVDMPVLATKYGSVAADLKTAGLTARQEELYRVALISARATLQAGNWAGKIAKTSVLGRNVAFLRAHLQELAALEATQMWRTP